MIDSIVAIPMYRVSPLEWEQEYERILDKQFEEYEATDEQIERYKERKRNTEYYHWKYNDVVAWIELYTDYNVVKARAFTTDRKRFQRGFHPIYKNNGKIAVEARIDPSKSNKEIVQDISERIQSWKQHYHKDKFWIDYTFLNSISWGDLVKK
jgi:hypothetical protein